MARKRKLKITYHASGWQKSRAKGRSGKGGKIDTKYKTLGGKRGRRKY